MKANLLLSGILIFVLFFITSCGEVKKQIASDQLLGKYEGKATFVYKHSMQNIGMKDEWKESSGTISIFKKESGDIYLSTSHGNARIAGVTLASNGATFSIPYQMVKQKDGSVKEIEGYQNAELEGARFDGMFSSETNSLTFGYQTLVKYDYYGQKADVLLLCQYEFNKIN